MHVDNLTSDLYFLGTGGQTPHLGNKRDKGRLDLAEHWSQSARRENFHHGKSMLRDCSVSADRNGRLGCESL